MKIGIMATLYTMHWPKHLCAIRQFNLIEGLLKAGYSEADIVKIMSGNLLRVLKQVEQTAQTLQK